MFLRRTLLALCIAAVPLSLHAAAPAAPAKTTGKPKVTPSGLSYYDLAPGAGTAAKAGDMVRVHYTGWLKNGTKFDSSLDRNEPFTFNLGRGQVIKGWDEGVAGMKPGGKRQLHIPANLAYGASGAGGVIPPNAELTFDVELIDAKVSTPSGPAVMQ